ncbi:hypothetical protein RN001_011021 [Aquatica leii]|uniref:Peptidase S1 domain-containing protein n=1 Tax=Aquatica leii TaxID=1421715 RepID=A0AAN7P1T2_9COLE|nr:hypothetical protein RN001_011021 [Aquatica leii]
MSFYIVSFLVLVVALSGVASSLNARIVNETNAANGEYPYMVSLRTAGNVHLCGGSILNHYWVLSAAMCLVSISTANVNVVVGTNSLRFGGVIYQVELVVIHPSYNSVTLIYDAGLIKTTTYIRYGLVVEPICLAHVLPDNGTVGALTGWGFTLTSTSENNLKVLKTKVMDQTVCKNKMSVLGYNLQFMQFCTFNEYAVGCVGDNGGPIVVDNKQFGILSWLTCIIDIPDIYTNVPIVRVSAEIEKRIINGTTVYNDDYPYMVSLRSTANYHFCGGSIVSRFWVLTSAVCVNLIPDFIVVVGTNSLSFGGVIYKVDYFLQHPLFNSTTLSYNAALIKTTNRIQFSRQVLPVFLARVLPFVGTVGVLTGWGPTSLPPLSVPDQLEALRTTVIEQSVCADAFTDRGYTLQSMQFCTFSNKSGGCYTDAGGPIVAGYRQFGILSIATCGSGYPDVYTRVPYIRQWIMKYI